MEKLPDYLKNVVTWEKEIYILGNSLWNCILAVVIAVAIYFLLRPLFNKVVSQFGGIVASTLKNSKSWFFAAVAVFFGASVLNLGEYDNIPSKVLILAGFIQFGIWMSVIFKFSLENWSQKNENQSQRAAIKIIQGLGKFLIWVVILLLILDNLGVKVISIITGLGISGIAVALAVQKILGDLFASISIMIDKPFEIDDLITIGEITGTVEAIGVKSTKIRSITGEQIIIANSDLLDSRISNFKRMSQRRTTLGISISSESAKGNLQTIIDMVKNIIDAQSDVRYDRGHLKSFSAASIDYEFVFWITKPEYIAYMDASQKVNMAIINAFEERGIKMAHPIQKVLLEK